MGTLHQGVIIPYGIIPWKLSQTTNMAHAIKSNPKMFTLPYDSTQMLWACLQAAFPRFWEGVFPFYTYLGTHEEFSIGLGLRNTGR